MTATCVVNVVLVDAQVEEEDLASYCSRLPVQMAGLRVDRDLELHESSQHPPEIP